MGLRNYLIEGLSGSGKTSVAEELHRRGHHVVHGDRTLAYLGDPATGQPVDQPPDLSPAEAALWLHNRWVWRVDQVKSLAADHGPAATFFCGGSRNFPQFTHLFTRIFVLEVDLATLTRRVASRPPDEFGGRPEELALIRRLHAARQDFPHPATPIDATAPVAHVVDQILSHCLKD